MSRPGRGEEIAMTHTEALQKAIDAGYVYGDSIYSYWPRKLKNMLREARREESSSIQWFFQEREDGKAEIYNSTDSEYHLCWK